MSKKTLVAMVIGVVMLGLAGCKSDGESSSSSSENNSNQSNTVYSDKDYWTCLENTMKQDDYRVDIFFQDENKSKYNWKDVMLINTYEDKKYVSMIGDVWHYLDGSKETFEESVAQIKEDYGLDVDESGLYVLGMFSEDEYITITDETSTFLKKNIADENYYDAFFRPLISGDVTALISNRMDYNWIECNAPSEMIISGLKNVMKAYEKDKNLEFVNTYKKTDTELIISLQEKGFIEWITKNVGKFKDYEFLLNNNLIKDKHEVNLHIELSGDYVSKFELTYDVAGCNDVAFILDFTESNYMEGKNVAETFKKSVEETVVDDWKYSLTKFLEYKLKNNVDTMEFKYGFDINDCNTVIEYAKYETGISKMTNVFDGYSYKGDINSMGFEIPTDEEFDNAYTAEELIELIKNY